MLGFTACAFPVFIWSIYNVLKEVPAWVLRLNTWDLVGTIAYTQVYALFESALIFIMLVLTAAILPNFLFRKKFIALVAILVFVTSIWFILAHFNDEKMREWGARQFLSWGLLYALSVMTSFLMVHRLGWVQKLIEKVVQRLNVLTLVYVLLGFASLIIVVIRNL